jgi:hypothetical protein
VQADSWEFVSAGFWRNFDNIDWLVVGELMDRNIATVANQLEGRMNLPPLNDRIERKYQIGIGPSEVANLWRDLTVFLGPYGLDPVHQITSVSSVYFDNKDCDLLRYSLLGHLMLVRIRVYEQYGELPQPIKEYWVEVKTARGERRLKRRFRLSRAELLDFLDGKDANDSVLANNADAIRRETVMELYRETQESIFTCGLKPILLVNTKRVAFQGEVSRLSVDWDLSYRHVNSKIFSTDCWMDLVAAPDGQSDNVILEIKFLQGDAPVWFSELQNRIAIWRREFLKPVQGMGYLFQGPLQDHAQADFFRTMIAAYLKNSELG